jgi:thioesterase-3
MEANLDIIVRSSEIDVNGHVNNAKYLEYLEWGREELYAKAHDEFGGFPSLGVHPTVVNVNISYRKECKQGDKLTIKSSTEKVGRTSFVLKQEIYNQRNELCSDALVTNVTVDNESNQSCEVPEPFRKLFP